MTRTCEVVEASLLQGEKGHAVKVTLADETTGVTSSTLVAHFPERFREVAVICAMAIEKQWKAAP